MPVLEDEELLEFSDILEEVELPVPAVLEEAELLAFPVVLAVPEFLELPGVLECEALDRFAAEPPEGRCERVLGSEARLSAISNAFNVLYPAESPEL